MGTASSMEGYVAGVENERLALSQFDAMRRRSGFVPVDMLRREPLRFRLGSGLKFPNTHRRIPAAAAADNPLIGDWLRLDDGVMTWWFAHSNRTHK